MPEEMFLPFETFGVPADLIFETALPASLAAAERKPWSAVLPCFGFVMWATSSALERVATSLSNDPTAVHTDFTYAAGLTSFFAPQPATPMAVATAPMLGTGLGGCVRRPVPIALAH